MVWQGLPKIEVTGGSMDVDRRPLEGVHLPRKVDTNLPGMRNIPIRDRSAARKLLSRATGALICGKMDVRTYRALTQGLSVFASLSRECEVDELLVRVEALEAARKSGGVGVVGVERG
jgi:hypothetical protein